MNTYLIAYVDGTTVEVEADFYEESGGEYIFVAAGEEVLRAEADRISGLTKTPLR